MRVRGSLEQHAVEMGLELNFVSGADFYMTLTFGFSSSSRSLSPKMLHGIME